MPSHQSRPPDNALDDEEHHSLCDCEEGNEHMFAIGEGNEYVRLATGEGMRLSSINYVRCSTCIFKLLLSTLGVYYLLFGIPLHVERLVFSLYPIPVQRSSVKLHGALLS